MKSKQKAPLTAKQQAPLIKAKIGTGLGYRTSDHFRSRTFGKPVNRSGFDPARFKTQHKG